MVRSCGSAGGWCQRASVWVTSVVGCTVGCLLTAGKQRRHGEPFAFSNSLTIFIKFDEGAQIGAESPKNTPSRVAKYKHMIVKDTNRVDTPNGWLFSRPRGVWGGTMRSRCCAVTVPSRPESRKDWSLPWTHCRKRLRKRLVRRSTPTFGKTR